MTTNLLTLNSLRPNLCSLVSVNNLPKFTTSHSTALTAFETLASYSMNTLPFPTRSLLSPNPAITIFFSFAVYVHSLIPKQHPPLPVPFSPSLTTATLFYHSLPKTDDTPAILSRDFIARVATITWHSRRCCNCQVACCDFVAWTNSAFAPLFPFPIFSQTQFQNDENFRYIIFSEVFDWCMLSFCKTAY